MIGVELFLKLKCLEHFEEPIEQPMYLSSEHLTRKGPKFKKGEQLVCPCCFHVVATANRDIYGHEQISSKPWDGLEPMDAMVCLNVMPLIGVEE